MIELPLVFAAGVLGSSHCVGMCGPFALTVGSTSKGWSANLRRQCVYSVGRIFTYSVIGAVCGFAGLRLAHSVPLITNLPAVLAVVAGGLLIYQGLAAAGVIGRRVVQSGSTPCLATTFFSAFLTAPGAGNAFLAGMFTGMLPCGLVYAFAALAASSANLLTGMLTMASFGAGTVPVMILTGFGGSLLRLAGRQRVFRIAAWCVVLAGLISLVRGFGFLHIPGWIEEPACPMCP